MKSLTNKPVLLLILTIILSSYFFASASLINISASPDAINSVLYTSVPEYNIVNFEFEEEEYIDDIPSLIIDDCIETNYQKALVQEFHFEEEKYIDDIPNKIFKKL